MIFFSGCWALLFFVVVVRATFIYNVSVKSDSSLCWNIDVVFNQDGSMFAARGENQIMIYSVPDMTQLSTRSEYASTYSGLAWSYDSSTSSSMGPDCIASLGYYSWLWGGVYYYTKIRFYNPSADWWSVSSSVENIHPPGLMAYSSTFIAAFLSSTVYVFNRASSDWSSIFSKNFGTVTALAISDNTLVVGMSSSVLVYSCTSSCSSVTTFSTSVTKLAITGNSIFVGSSTGVKVYRSASTTSWSSPTSVTLFPPFSLTSGEIFGQQMTTSSDGSLVLIGTGKYGHVYYLNSGSWVCQYSIPLTGSPFGTTSSGFVSSAAIAKTSQGYVALFGYNPCQSCTTASSAVLFNVTCDSKSFGINCSACSCVHGSCDSNMWNSNNNGKCLSCSSTKWYGPKCNLVVSCVNGMGSSGINGTGVCTSCNVVTYKPVVPTPTNIQPPVTGWIGQNCSKNCSCQFGKCNDGINGTGLCTECWPGFYGQLCSQRCLCTGGCFDGIKGNGTCVSCPENHFGASCNASCTCSSLYGLCRSGLSGDGFCSSCNDGYYGKNCDNACTCLNGTCDDGPSGSGLCDSCFTGYFGLNCSNPNTCQFGIPNEGIYGNGLCLSCQPGYFGPNCDQNCTCKDSSNCFDGINGNGKCLFCSSKTVWGPNCEKNCTCGFGVCNSSVSGDGTCLVCNPTYFGPECTSPCLCNTEQGVCRSTVLSNGTCTECFPRFAGENCSITCSCLNGLCNDDIYGDGKCLYCMDDTKYFGPNCKNCTCLHGTCQGGVNGTGRCSACENGFFGPNCNYTCTCEGDSCLSVPYLAGNGNCLNECLLKTHNCEQICLKRIYNEVNKNWSCSCRNGYFLNLDATSCSNCLSVFSCESNVISVVESNLIILISTTSNFTATSSNVSFINSTFQGSSSFVSSSVYLQGNENRFGAVNFGSTNVHATPGTTTVINGNLVAKNTVFSVSLSSRFNLSGCLDFSNTSLVLVDDGSSNSVVATPFQNFLENCTSYNFSDVALQTATTCRKGEVTKKRSRSTVIFEVSFYDECNSSFPVWLIATISLVCAFIVVIVIIVVSLKCEDMTRKLFPYRSKPPEHFSE